MGSQHQGSNLHGQAGPFFKGRWTAVAALAGSILLVALVVLPSFWALRQVKSAGILRQQTYEVIRHADALLSALKDAETSQRGFALTGDESFLEPYLEVRDSLVVQMVELRRLSTDTEANRHLDALAPLVDGKIAEMAAVVELRRSRGLGPARNQVGAGRGKRLMDAIRAEMAGLNLLEEDLLRKHDADFQANLRWMFTIIAVSSLFVLLLALSFLFVMYRQTQQRLRNLVHQETRHLLEIQESTNVQLQAANATLRESEEELEVTLNCIGDAVIATDAAGRVTRMNPVAEQLTGWKVQEALGRTVDEVFHIISQETRLPSRIPVLETLARGTVQGLANHTILVARGGGERSIADSCAPIRNRDGRVVGAVLIFRDVTEEYAARQALRESSGMIQTILGTVVDGIITFRADGGEIETVNPAAERMFGYAAAELRGQGIGLLVPELAPGSSEASPAPLEGSGEHDPLGPGREVVGRRRDGGSFPLEMAVGQMQQGGQRYFTGILRDISARREAEEELHQAGALQRAIFDSPIFSSIATDASGVIQIFNVGAERMLGYEALEVVDKLTFADLSDPLEEVARAATLSLELGTAIAPGFEAMVCKASRGIEDIYEMTLVRKDATRFPAVLSVTALRDTQGQIIGYLLMGKDNTAGKRNAAVQEELARKLRDHQFYTRSLFESNIDALVTTDASGIITDANRQMERLTDCTRDELIGAPFRNCFTDPERADAGIRLVLTQKRVANFELTASARNGKETVVSYNASTIYDRDRKLQGVYAAARDVTDQKRMDVAMQEKNEELVGARDLAQKANLAKSDFLSSMSHELRSPLNAILGFAQLMDSDSPPPTPPQKASIDQILHAGWYLLELINEILDLAVIESGKISLSLEPVSLPEVLDECQAMVEQQGLKRGLGLAFPSFGLPSLVRADRIRLKQVLINLLSNAIKYNRQGGSIVVECATVPSGRTRISIRDTGEGLPSEKVAELFQPFNRLGQEGGAKEGTGIGLVVSKLLVDLMGGTIGAESTVGVGSVFWFELETAEATQVAQGGDTPLAHGKREARPGEVMRTLLYVEDNTANLKLVEQIIARRPNLRLLSAMNGLMGIKIAREFLPDVILMDINLPGISGLEAMKILRSDPLTGHIPVLAISANAMAGDIAKGLQAGFLRYLTKPIRVNEFMEALDAAAPAAHKGG